MHLIDPVQGQKPLFIQDTGIIQFEVMQCYITLNAVAQSHGWINAKLYKVILCSMQSQTKSCIKWYLVVMISNSTTHHVHNYATSTNFR